MSTRFDADDTSEIWTLLNELDDGIVKGYATTTERDAEQNPPLIAVIGTAANFQVMARDGNDWRLLYQYLAGGDSGGVTCQRFANGIQLVGARISLTGLAANVAGSQVVTFPQPFAGVPRFSTATFGAAPLTAAASVAEGSATSVRVYGARTSAGDLPIDLTVIGRWK
ncbi:MAG: hypothetical protein QM753_06765 [Thermomicrobiales bacterium]